MSSLPYDPDLARVQRRRDQRIRHLCIVALSCVGVILLIIGEILIFAVLPLSAAMQAICGVLYFFVLSCLMFVVGYVGYQLIQVMADTHTIQSYETAPMSPLPSSSSSDEGSVVKIDQEEGNFIQGTFTTLDEVERIPEAQQQPYYPLQ